jgi:hypothetical protein
MVSAPAGAAVSDPAMVAALAQVEVVISVVAIEMMAAAVPVAAEEALTTTGFLVAKT